MSLRDRWPETPVTQQTGKNMRITHRHDVFASLTPAQIERHQAEREARAVRNRQWAEATIAAERQQQNAKADTMRLLGLATVWPV